MIAGGPSWLSMRSSTRCTRGSPCAPRRLAGAKGRSTWVRCRLVPGMGDACAPVGIPPAAKASLDDPLIAVCMATYNPPPDLFRVQIESIRAQTDRNWFCVISDDASDAGHVAAMMDVIAGDPRFALIQQPDRLGFYGNFERVLALAPLEAELLALSDQAIAGSPQTLLFPRRDALRCSARLCGHADSRSQRGSPFGHLLAVPQEQLFRLRSSPRRQFGHRCRVHVPPKPPRSRASVPSAGSACVSRSLDC